MGRALTNKCVSEAGKGTRGYHVLADMYGVPSDILCNKVYLTDVLLEALERCGFCVMESVSRKFPGEGAGVTVMVLLGESHASVHTYPEESYLAMDVFSCCGKDAEGVVSLVSERLSPTERSVQGILRGQ